MNAHATIVKSQPPTNCVVLWEGNIRNPSGALPQNAELMLPCHSFMISIARLLCTSQSPLPILITNVFGDIPHQQHQHCRESAACLARSQLGPQNCSGQSSIRARNRTWARNLFGPKTCLVHRFAWSRGLLGPFVWARGLLAPEVRLGQQLAWA